MMPKGVEHRLAAAVLVGVVGVIISMMPKGVEHTRSPGGTGSTPGVIISMMPKGVEHKTLAIATLSFVA